MNPDRTHIGAMFDRVAPRYDLLNRLLSGRRDVAWRKTLVASLNPDDRLLDLACGTGDVMAMARCHDAIGVDVSTEMLRHAKAKFDDKKRGDNEARALLIQGDALSLPLPDTSVDAVTMAFGIRNTPEPSACLREIQRVLSIGGRALILEFSLPTSALIRRAYLLYFRHILPTLGGLLSGDRAAYRYLNESVESFPYGEAFCQLMRDAAFTDITATQLTFGIASIYTGRKTAT